MSLRLPLSKNKFLTIISVYVIMLTLEESIKNSFYDQLHDILVKIPVEDKLILMVDFNARVGRDSKENGNGRLLLQLCAVHCFF